MPSVGRYRILVLASNDLLETSGSSQSALDSCVDIIEKFPAGVIELIVIHPLAKRFEWSDLPPRIKEVAEMRTYGLAKTEDAYKVYGVSKESGMIAVVRPDGYIGMLSSIVGVGSVEEYFRSCLVSV
jgi:phenol 2-monooxygenase